jgi:EAL domain-containing protein (putative c-di-GMP-specific phosphodiesterase class I)
MIADVALCAACAKTLAGMKNKSIPEYFTLTFFVALGLISFVRLGLVLSGLDKENVLDAVTFYQKLYLSSYTIVFIALMFGFMLIVSRRLRKTLMYLSAYSDFDGRAREESWQLGRDLKRAIAQDELVMHFQPRVNIKTGEVVAVEALLRWNHPSQGLLTPNNFIDAAEGTDAIRYIGEWVVQKAVDSLNRLHRIQPGIRMSLNMSPRQLAYATFVPLIAQALKDAEFHPSQLELELTESVVMDDPEEAETMMWDLKKLGIRLSIDDFGTGYSSLSYLKRLPVDCVKIDRSFIEDVPFDQGDVAITKAIIAMGHALDLSVVAEGVETHAQLAFLAAAACDEYQGYLFSKALPKAELVALLENRNLRRTG